MSIHVRGSYEKEYSRKYYRVNGMILTVIVVASGSGKEITGVFSKIN